MTDKGLRSGEAAIVQKQAEEALRESETRFRRISAITSDIAYSCHTEEDGRFSIDWMTGAAGRITGYSGEEIKAQGCWRFLVVEEDIALFEENVVGLAPGSHGSCELRIRRKNGDVVWISSFAECVSDPEIPGRLLLYGGLADISERKRAEENLAKNKELLSETEKMAHIGGWVFDAETLTQEWTEETFRILEVDVTKSEPKVPEALDFIAPAFRPMADEGIRRAIEFGEPYDQEWEIITAKGNRRWVHAVAKAYQEQGKTKRVSGSFQDITDRKQTEEESQRERAFLDRLIETAPEGIAISDPQARVMRVNAEFVRVFGYGADEAVGQCIDDLVVPPARQEEARALTTSASQGSEILLETVRRRKDGTLVDVSLIVAPILVAGKLEAIYGIYRDITKRKRAEDALRESEERYRTLIQNMGEGIGFVDPEEQFAFTNAAAEDLFGVPPGGLLGHSLREFTRPEQFGMIREQTDRRQAGEKSVYEVEINRPKGEKRNLLITAVPQFDSQGRFVGTLGVFRDISERKRAEEALRELGRFNEQIISSATDGIVVYGPDLRYQIWNPYMEKLTGLAAGDVLGRQPLELFPFLQEGGVIERLEKVLVGEKVDAVIFPYRVQQSGRSGWTEDITSPLLDSQGKIVGAIGIVRDITSRKQMETSLQEARVMAERYLNVAAEVILGLDAQGNITLLNDSGHRLLGYAPGELIGKNWFDTCLPEEARTEVHGVFAKLMEGEYADVMTSENLVVTRSGNRLDLLWHNTLLRDTDGRIVGALSSAEDITQRKQAEEALRESEENFRHSLDDSPLGVRIVTAEGETIYANRAILDIYGFSSLEELRTTPVKMRYTPESYVEFKKRYERRQQGEDSPSEYEVNIVRKNGEVRHLLVSRKGQLWNGKKQYQLLYRDITERKQAEEASEKAEAQLRQSQKMEAIGTLAGGVAHDFNNLLTGILGNIALMRSSLPPADPLLENLDAAETAARQAADLTKGLLTFSRSAMVLPVPMNITAALDATLALLKQSLPATMEIVRDYEQTAWNVLVDQSQMTQILLNLAVNARDAMKGKGTLTIRARNEVVGEEYLQTHPFARTGEFVHLSVTDTGPGMSSEVMQHLFEPFYTTKPIGSGTGLGLSIVYGAVKQAGGWITAASTEGVERTAPQKHPSDWKNIHGGIGQTCSGATFDIYLPRCLEEPKESFTSSPLSVNVRGGTVLVVEDEPVVRTVTQALLSRSGYTVLTAPDGASALNVLRDHPVGIGLILLDMTMPGMTTGEIVQAIRALDPPVPILLNSGYASNGTVKQMLEGGSVQGFLGKPYDLNQLLEKVQMLLHRG